MPNMSNVAVAAPNPASTQSTYWLALALTQGLGPTRIKKLIEHYGTAERVFQASLTELEATGMRAVSAQSLATGKSLELAQQECVKAAEANAKIISLGDPEYPSRLKEIYDPPVVLFVKGNVEVLAHPWYCDGGDASSDALRQRHGRTALDRTGIDVDVSPGKHADRPTNRGSGWRASAA